MPMTTLAWPFERTWPYYLNPSPEMPLTIQFQEIPIGQCFEFRGRRYQKLALSMASDEDRNGNIFQPQTKVLPDAFLRAISPMEVACSPPYAKAE